MDRKLMEYAREGARQRLAALEREREAIEQMFPGIVQEHKRQRLLDRMKAARDARRVSPRASKKA